MSVGVHAVTVGGADISCLVDTVSIVHGRDDSGSQPDASAATVEFTATPLDPLPPEVEVGAAVLVTTTTPSGSSTRFAGRVTDLSLGWAELGEWTPDNGVGQLVAVGPLADLGRRVVGAEPFPQELDGARVRRVLGLAGITLNSQTSDPGTVQILPRDIDATAALDAARGPAISAGGLVWETRAGEIRYADAEHRRNTQATLALDSCDLLVTPTWRRNIEGLVNEISLGYGVAPEGGEQPRYIATAPQSVDRWGRYGYSAATELADLADAEAIGSLLLVRNSSPVWVMAALPVDVAGLDDARYEALLALDVHSLVALTGLPSLGTAPSAVNLWVEGWHEDLAYGAHDVQLVVSGYCRTAPAVRWDDVDPGTVWGDMVVNRRNLLLNPSVEVGTHWTAARGTFTAGPLYHPVSGTKGGRYSSSDSSTAGGNYVYHSQASVLVDEGVTYTFSAYVGPTVGTRDFRALLQWWDAAGVYMSQARGVDVTCTTEGLTRIHVTAAAPPGAVKAQCLIVCASAMKLGHQFHWDAAMLTDDPEPVPYFDGSTPPTTTALYQWTGAPNASTSTQAVATEAGGVPPGITWDDAACFGGPPIDYGRWNDQPATLRWNQIRSDVTWDTYQ